MKVDLRRPWPFALFVLVAHVTSRFIGVAVHEFLGHAAFAFLLGGSAYGVYASPGSGVTFVYLPQDTPAAAVVAMLGAGIGVEALAGVLLWWRTRRSPSFGWRAFGLVAGTVLIVYSFVYMAAGALDGFPGDTWAIVSTLQDPPLAAGFVAVGGLWSLLVGVLLSLDVVRLFGGPGRDLRREAYMLLLYWVVPAPLSFLPGFSAFGALEGSPALYVAAFSGVLCFVAGFLLYVDLRVPHPAPAPGPGVDWRPVVAAALPLLFFVPVWVVAFGVTQDTAHGVLLETPPVEVEPAWLGALAINLEVVVRYSNATGYDVGLIWRFHGTFEARSPLEARILDSFRDRMDHVFYNAVALSIVGDAMNESSWLVIESDIHPAEAVWSGGVEYAGARVVRLSPSPVNFRSFLTTDGGGTTVLTVHDPFKFEPTAPSEGWMDALTVSWDNSVLPVRFSGSGGTAAPIVSANYVLWESFNRFQAQDTYQVGFVPR